MPNNALERAVKYGGPHPGCQPFLHYVGSALSVGVAALMPPQVRRAINLLWVSFVLGLLNVALLVSIDPETREIAGIMLFFSALAAAVFAILIVAAARRRNWARIVLLVTVVVTPLAYIFFPSESPEPWWSVVSTIVSSILEAIAMIWLFLGAGARWYSRKQE